MTKHVFHVFKAPHYVQLAMQQSNLHPLIDNRHTFTKYTNVSPNTMCTNLWTTSLLLLEVVLYHSLGPLLVHGPRVVYLLRHHPGDLRGTNQGHVIRDTKGQTTEFPIPSFVRFRQVLFFGVPLPCLGSSQLQERPISLGNSLKLI